MHVQGANATHAWFCLASINPFHFLKQRKQNLQEFAETIK